MTKNNKKYFDVLEKILIDNKIYYTNNIETNEKNLFVCYFEPVHIVMNLELVKGVERVIFGIDCDSNGSYRRYGNCSFVVDNSKQIKFLMKKYLKYRKISLDMKKYIDLQIKENNNG